MSEYGRRREELSKNFEIFFKQLLENPDVKKKHDSQEPGIGGKTQIKRICYEAYMYKYLNDKYLNERERDVGAFWLWMSKFVFSAELDAVAQILDVKDTKITQEEFDKFWNEVFGDRFYVEEGDCEGEYVYLKNIIVYPNDFNDTKPPNFVSKQEWIDGITVEEVYLKWRKQQTHDTVIAKFEPEKANTKELINRLKSLGAVSVN